MRGYEAVTIRQIATAVGIKESSVYNHFENKQDILDTIVRETINRYEKVLQESNVPGIEDPDVSGSFDSICDEDFYQMCTGVFLFYLKDEYISKLRRLLTIEQYSNPELGKTFKNIFINNILENQAKVLQKFIDSGRFIPGDAYMVIAALFRRRDVPADMLRCFYYFINMTTTMKTKSRPSRN